MVPALSPNGVKVPLVPSWLSDGVPGSSKSGGSWTDMHQIFKPDGEEGPWIVRQKSREFN